MSRIEELIEKLCPNGVEYKELEKVCRFQNGFSFKSTLFRNCGEPILRITNILNGKLSDDSYVYFNLEDYKENLENYKVKKGDVVVAMSGATTGKIGYNYSENIYYLNQRVGLFVPNEKVLLKRFLFHWLTTQSKKIHNISSGSGAQPNLSSVKMMKLKIPVPPLEVQCEIVHILDDFTELSAELSAELKARKKQYEYYNKLLLSFDNGIPVVKLRDIIDFKNGKGHENVVEKNGKYILVTSKAISTDMRNVRKTDRNLVPLYYEDIVMVMSDLPNGKALAKCFLVDEDEKYTLNQRIGCFTNKREDIINTKFLYYILNRNSQLLKYDNGVEQTNLRKDDILNIDIPIPKKEQQIEIIKVLDKFDKLCNDISEGLPAEIEARQKQYEYYRDKLLTFKELKVNE